MTIASIHSELSSRSRLSARSTLPPSLTNALGLSLPSRSPVPAAARTAQTPLTPACRRAYPLRDRDFGEDLVEPGRGLVLVECLRVHELAREDLLRLHEHLLLARRESLLLVSQGKIPHDFGQLEDVARLHLVAVVLEAAIPVLGHLRARTMENLEDLLDHVLVDHLAEADALCVLRRNVHRHVVVQDLDR